MTNDQKRFQQDQQPQESGILDVALVKIFGWTFGTIFAPLWILFTDNSLAVRGRTRTPGAQDIVGKTFAIFAFPFLAVFILALFPVTPMWILPSVAPLAWLAVAKRIPARSFTDFSTAAILRSIRHLPKRMLITSLIFVAISYTVALATEQVALGGLLTILAGYPAAYALGRDRHDNVSYESTQADGFRRMMGLILGLSESQAAEIFVTSSGKGEDLRISTGPLSLDVVGKLSGLEAAIQAHLPEWQVISASADGVTIGVATPEVIEQRQRLAASGGLVAGVSEAHSPTPNTGFTASSDGFAPGDVF